MTVPPADEATGVAETGTEAEPEPEADEFVCGPCQRNKHRRCRSPECRCCYGGDDDG